MMAGAPVTVHGESGMLRWMNLAPSQEAIESVMRDIKKGPKRVTHV
jgi:hypothetical protein